MRASLRKLVPCAFAVTLTGCNTNANAPLVFFAGSHSRNYGEREFPSNTRSDTRIQGFGCGDCAD